MAGTGSLMVLDNLKVYTFTQMFLMNTRVYLQDWRNCVQVD